MRSRIGREVALLCLPVLVIVAGAWWRNRDSPPEDISSGPARLVTRVRVLDTSPLDRYRGYNHRIAIDQWAAGQLPPSPLLKAGVVRTSQQVVPRLSPLYVVYRQGKNWHRTYTVSELAERTTDHSLKTLRVKPKVASLWLPVVDDAGQGQSKFTSTYLLRLPASPPVDEALLCGRLRAELEDRAETLVAGVINDDIVKQSELLSQPMKVPLELPGEAENEQGESPTNATSRRPEWEVEKVTAFLPGSIRGSGFLVDLSIRPTSGASTLGRVQLLNSRLLDGSGREVAKAISSGSGGGNPARSNLMANVQFQMTPQQWKSLSKPLTLQTTLSVNNEWPVEVNLEMGKPNVEELAKPSKLPFKREPLPQR